MPLPAASLLLRGLRTPLVPLRNLTSKPAKHSIGAGEQAFALTVFFVTILGPSGWVLAHLDDYKNKK